MIRIVNLHNYSPTPNEILFKVDRSSIVGNPFFMHGEPERDLVCNKYADYFESKIFNDAKFTDYLQQIYDASKFHDVALGCWCYPKHCHAETIKEFIESF